MLIDSVANIAIKNNVIYDFVAIGVEIVSSVNVTFSDNLVARFDERAYHFEEKF